MIGILLGNRYELLKKIGEGGMAEVYKAKCHLLNRYVAVKILKDEFSSDAQFVEKFKREATAAASLSDNNIVDIYDVGSQDGINYIVMEYVEGKTLKQLIKEDGALTVNKTISIAIQIAKALSCAHKNNIIHRDIKPHNILVTEDEVVKVTDFGIAKASNSVTITNTSKVMGSAHYFSPEQAKGSFIDCRTDIYSLGIVMYEMVTGKLPYDGESPVSIALKHIQEPVVPPKRLNSSIPDDLNSIILKTVEKQPINRYQNVKDLILDLKKVQNHENVNIKFADIDQDQTRIMDAVKVDSDTQYFNQYDNLEEETEEKQPMDFKKKKMIVIITAIILLLSVGFASYYALMNKFNNPNGKVFSKSAVVPNVIGLSKDEAKKLVEEKGLVFQISGKENSDKPEGTIISCFPKEGTMVKSKTEVRVIISSGKEQLAVPDLQDIDLEVAKDILKRYGLTFGNVSYEYNNILSKNCVIRQNPSKQSKVDAGSKVDLVVSKGPEIKYSTVPSLNGKTIDEAKVILSNANLKFGGKKSVETSDKSLDGIIFEQNVEANIQVKEGTSVSVSYYVYKEEKKPSDDEEIKDKDVKVEDEQPESNKENTNSNKKSTNSKQ